MAKAKYVDGFVFVVPQKNLAAYKKMAKEGAKTWKKYGALDYMECKGDDVNPKMAGDELTSFPKISGMKKGETVWFSYITFKDKKHRDAVNKKVMAYWDEKYKDSKKAPAMPFDMARMAYGGFKVEVGM